jgi:uncharacterized protein (DUF486 family)
MIVFNTTSVIAILCIYMGTVMYTIASYYHLKFEEKEWTFIRAFLIAMPLVVIEYVFSLNGNHLAHTVVGLSPMQILLLTMCFYFINLWILNRVVLRHDAHILKNLVAFVFILCAFWISDIIK